MREVIYTGITGATTPCAYSPVTWENDYVSRTAWQAEERNCSICASTGFQSRWQEFGGSPKCAPSRRPSEVAPSNRGAVDDSEARAYLGSQRGAARWREWVSQGGLIFCNEPSADCRREAA
ncbi:hypothetical protein ISCGN_004009 [Ixodes scapularis]